MLPERRRTLLTILSLAVLYTVWGSTYLAQRIAVTTFEPLQMAGIRFVLAGGLLYPLLRARGAPAPTPREWRAVVLSAVPLLVTGMGAAAVGIKRVPSGLAALMFGSVPLWTSLFDWLWGGKLRRSEVLGLTVGFAGVALVSLRGGSLPTRRAPSSCSAPPPAMPSAAWAHAASSSPAASWAQPRKCSRAA